MGVVGGIAGGLLGGGLFGGGGDDSGGASVQAANTQVAAQREALDYLKEREAIPRQFSEGALRRLGGIYGLEGGEGSQQQMIESAMTSPLYKSIIGGRESGEEAILRNVAATGGLRSGNVQEALYDYNTQLENQALLEAYNQQVQGLSGLAGLPSMAPLIAQTTAGIGQTQAQGIVGAAQSRQAEQESNWNRIMGIAQLGMSAAGMFSDRRLKKNLKKVGKVKGYNWYTWDWNGVAEKMGLKGSCSGVLADEIYDEHKDAVFLKDLFLMVDYSKLGILEASNG